MLLMEINQSRPRHHDRQLIRKATKQSGGISCIGYMLNLNIVIGTTNVSDFKIGQWLGFAKAHHN